MRWDKLDALDVRPRTRDAFAVVIAYTGVMHGPAMQRSRHEVVRRLTVAAYLALISLSLLAAGCRPSGPADGDSDRSGGAAESAPVSAPALASAPSPAPAQADDPTVAQADDPAMPAAQVTARAAGTPLAPLAPRPTVNGAVGTATVAAIPRATLRPTDPPTEPLPAAPTPAGPLAPELDGLAWLNSEPLSMAGQRGKVVMIDFWTFG